MIPDRYRFCKGRLREGKTVFLLLLIMVATLVPPAVAEPYMFVRTWGTNGTGNSQFINPSGITVDSGGFVYVADTALNRVQKFDPKGNFMTSWEIHAMGSTVPEASQLTKTGGIHKDAYGNIYVIDAGDGKVSRIRKYTADGISNGAWGSYGSDHGQFKNPWDLATDSQGNLYVTDTGNNRIEKFLPDGTYQATFGSPGSGDGQFNRPLGIAIGPADTIYVADSGNNRIQKFSTNGTFLGAWGSEGPVRGQFSGPAGLTTDTEGNVFVVDSLNYRIQVFDMNGSYRSTWGSKGPDAGHFIAPLRIAVDTHDGVYVLEYDSDTASGTGKRRVQKFEPESVALTATTGSRAPATIPVTPTPLTSVPVPTVTITTPGSKTEADTVVVVSSEPSGATVYIDEVMRGTTPTSILLPKGTYTLKLKKDGHKDDESALSITSKETVTVSRTLQAPGFTILLALAALGMVAVLVQRRR